MAYCSSCGTQISDNTKFCPECGSPNASSTVNSTQRQHEFKGKIIKCPNCGEVLKAFEAICPSCGHEVRGVKGSDSIREFALRIAKAENDAQQINLIRNFPIPNTKEDVLEFMILAATNFNATHSLENDAVKKSLADAWLAKVEQGYEKAKLLFGKDKDFFKIQNVYNQTHERIKASKQNANRHAMINLALRTIGLWGGLGILFIAFLLDIFFYTNTSVFHLGGGAVMIVGALMIGRRTKGLFDVGVGVMCGVLALLLGVLLEEVFYGNGSAMQLAGGATIIITVVRLLKSYKEKGD